MDTHLWMLKAILFKFMCFYLRSMTVVIIKICIEIVLLFCRTTDIPGPLSIYISFCFCLALHKGVFSIGFLFLNSRSLGAVTKETAGYVMYISLIPKIEKLALGYKYNSINLPPVISVLFCSHHLVVRAGHMYSHACLRQRLWAYVSLALSNLNHFLLRLGCGGGEVSFSCPGVDICRSQQL